MSLVQFTTQLTYPSSLLHIILMFFYGILLLALLYYHINSSAL